MSEKKDTPKNFTLFLTVIYGITAVLLAWYLVSGFDYYRTPLIERPHHPEHFRLKPGGEAGHGFGVFGVLLILLTYVYTARKKWKPLKKIGTIPKWLDIHIYFGIMGPLLIVLHSAFKIHGLIAVAFWSMTAVALSGFIGRFLMRQIPRDIKGHETDISELRKLRDDMRSRMIKGGLNPEQIDRMEKITERTDQGSVNPVTFLLALLLNSSLLQYRMSRCLQEFSSEKMPVADRRALKRVAHEELILTRRIHLLRKSKSIFQHWHRIHKPFSVVMLIISAIHIALAVYLGYIWIPG